MEPFVLEQETFFLIKNWTNEFSGLVAGMTSKNGGFSKEAFSSLNLGFHVGDQLADVCSNRQRVAKEMEFPLKCWVGAEQTHDVHIQKLIKTDKGKGADSYQSAFRGTDGFYTDIEGILLTLCFADCVPLFFIAPEKKMIGIAHAGWKGTVKQIAAHMVDIWKQENISSEQIYVTIGPSICKKCYIVDNRIIDLVQNILVDVEKKPYTLVEEGQYQLDLRELNRLILIKAGIPARNIQVTSYCSSCDQDEFFSHRRDHGRTGRMLSFIGWKEGSSH